MQLRIRKTEYKHKNPTYEIYRKYWIGWLPCRVKYMYSMNAGETSLGTTIVARRFIFDDLSHAEMIKEYLESVEIIKYRSCPKYRWNHLRKIWTGRFDDKVFMWVNYDEAYSNQFGKTCHSFYDSIEAAKLSIDEKQDTKKKSWV